MSVEKKSHKAVDFIEDMDFTTDKPLIFQADEIEGFSTDCTATPRRITLHDVVHEASVGQKMGVCQARIFPGNIQSA